MRQARSRRDPPGAASAMFGLAAHLGHLSRAFPGKIVRLPAGTMRSIELNTIFRGVEMVAIRQAALSVFALTAAASGLASPSSFVPQPRTARPRPPQS